jgi:hypothetical protein
MLAPRNTSLDRDEPGGATLDVGRPWWVPRRPWPKGMRFQDVDPAVLQFERLTDNAPLGPPPAPPGSIGCTAALCEESRFAEPEVVSR